MSFKKTFAVGLLALSVCGLPVLAQAADLHLKNNTKFDSTSRTNNDQCSDQIPGGSGVTKAGGESSVKELFVVLACRANRENCTADVYLSNNCSGPKIATVIIDSKKFELKSIQMLTDAYDIKQEPGKFGFILSPA